MASVLFADRSPVERPGAVVLCCDQQERVRAPPGQMPRAAACDV